MTNFRKGTLRRSPANRRRHSARSRNAQPAQAATDLVLRGQPARWVDQWESHLQCGLST